ncbi:Endonuclease/Exonuclease/phosphatase family protein [Thalassovita gelatinovora]|uniref:Endonuclease/Exonuclease/phosphatase family protein n=1 Tax=Thalassovita gelatinovora TaxID=53501 RepID=A0A0P1FCK8_THAGE|nr:endonuclease/exonuclease/phosphatase family protein [Thalassovita gelatinovora]QIZ80438.1 alpha-1,4 polygalactosaminidase [Thalassovita gelatinovora]CUH65832.1 Endonuclease/Exonuclease/phosphatase family protein [Thalassovita gelatinovora]SEQ72487.1 Endonuclease/Exonuclease/phosphatase family protein [Thalassovita gelatinovora]
MTNFTIASFNIKNLIGANQEYYQFQTYTPEEYAWKLDWVADQILTMDADIVGFQEVFEEDALRDVIEEADIRGEAYNAAVIPDASKRYHKKAIFRKLGYTPYRDAALAFAPNSNDNDLPGQRRPGVAILSRMGFADRPEIIQDLDDPLVIPFRELTGEDAGHYTISRLSRPILKVRVPVGREVITVFCSHFKSKLGEFVKRPGAPFAPEADLTRYDPAGRAIGSLRSALRRMAEAWVLRRAILAELDKGRPVIALGDFNDGEHSVSSEIVSGETPFINYSWMLRHNAQHETDRYSHEEAKRINDAVERVRLHSAEKLFVRKSMRDMVYTAAFGGVYESIDQIFLSRHFHPDYKKRIGEMKYFSTFNDHITDGSHPEAPYNKLASDHGQIMAHIRLGVEDK